MKQVLSAVSKRLITLKQVTSRLYLKIMTVIFVWMSSMQYPHLLCQCPNLLVIVNQVSICVPTKLQDALSNPKWMDAMNVEMDALNKNKTWDLVPLQRVILKPMKLIIWRPLL
ncbi:unnamed protein product [Prunus armeniaca]